jgi:hypothetical protein
MRYATIVSRNDATVRARQSHLKRFSLSSMQRLHCAIQSWALRKFQGRQATEPLL